MARINYVAERETFMRYAFSNRLKPAERLLWEALFSIFNSRASGDAWPEGFVSVRSWELEEYTGMGRDSIIRARKSLCERGLICFHPGEGQHAPAGYRMHYISAYGAPEPSQNTTVNYPQAQIATVVPSQNATVPTQNATVPTQNATVPTQIATVEREQIDRNIDKPFPNGINYINDGLTDCNIYQEKGGARVRAYKDIYQEKEYALEMGERQVRDAFKAAFGRDIYPEELRTLLDERRSPELCAEAIRLAAEAGARYPARCAAGIMNKWDSRVETVDELRKWEELSRLTGSPNPDVAGKAEHSLKAFFKQLASGWRKSETW